ncbi:unnamed protein product [Hyaloperonospora brassicae]|uniref:RXLR phytopathogen effector protein WY-domain domain-containing protein n=1 Tax=Hyaloperonospora brassicae TaxID=162125 RepID=A0AAV0THW3_HYABA|nr:unnamed protein product [Hyaloperonospora brassicae]
MRRLCIVAAGFGGLLAESAAGPLADGHQTSSSAAELHRLRHDKAKSDQRRLVQPHGSVEHMTASEAPRLSTSYETDRMLHKSEDRGVTAEPIRSFGAIMADFLNRGLHPNKMFEGLSLHEKVARPGEIAMDPDAVIMWLEYAKKHPNMTIMKALEMLTSKSKSEIESKDDYRNNRLLLDELLVHYKVKNENPIINEALKLLISEMAPHESSLAIKELEKMEVSSRDLFDLLGLKAKDALAKSPEAAIFWLKYIVHAAWVKTYPPQWDARLNPDHLFPMEAVRLLVKGRSPGDVQKLIGEIKSSSRLELVEILYYLENPATVEAVLRSAKQKKGPKKKAKKRGKK